MTLKDGYFSLKKGKLIYEVLGESFFDLSEQCPNAVTFTIILPSIISRNSLILFCFPENVIK